MYNRIKSNYQTPKTRNKGCVGIHGERERRRRRKQISRGQLKVENGLDISYIPQYKFKNDYKPQDKITID